MTTLFDSTNLSEDLEELRNLGFHTNTDFKLTQRGRRTDNKWKLRTQQQKKKKKLIKKKQTFCNVSM